jgi:tRNA-splicing ligase RtcB
VSPAAVGVDIGCGMAAVQTNLTANDLPESLGPIRSAIEAAIPVGFSEHDEPAFGHVSEPVKREVQQLFREWKDLTPAVRDLDGKAKRQVGTLGGGNHFIEVCLDESQGVWVMLHSGSRGIGNAIGTYFIELAKKDFQRNDVHLPDRDLAYFPEGAAHFDDYVEAVGWAQDYARANRAEMLELVVEGLRRHLPAFDVTRQAVNCHHNYVQRERHYGEDVWLTRKGAIRAGKGELGIIPGSMGARSYIVRGKGSAESFDSCAHGAGRLMSRNAAQKKFSLKDLEQQTQGVVCRKDKGVIDEIPGAYKSIDEVMANQSDLVEVVHTLKQVLCVKG